MAKTSPTPDRSEQLPIDLTYYQHISHTDPSHDSEDCAQCSDSWTEPEPAI
jgi:hypothetical protein